MRISLNGEHLELPEGCTVWGLLEHLQVDPMRVAVECNLDVVPRRRYADRPLAPGDCVEVVTFVGGG